MFPRPLNEVGNVTEESRFGATQKNEEVKRMESGDSGAQLAPPKVVIVPPPDPADLALRERTAQQFHSYAERFLSFFGRIVVAVEGTSTAPSDLLTKKEAAKFLKITTRTLDRYRDEGLIHAVKYQGGAVRFTKRELEKFLSKHRES
jgi:excisionase family DNA binding protein